MPEQTYLAFDYGRRRVGLAVGQAITATASALQTVATPQSEAGWACIDEAVRTWRPDAFVLGVPLTESGEEQEMSVAARAFGDELKQRYELPVYEADERYTSQMARQRFVEQRRAGAARRRDAAKEDAVAAELILAQWLEGAR